MLYVATNRLSFVAIGLSLFAVGVVVPRQHPRRRSRTASTPGSTRSAALYDKPGGSYQLAQSLFAQADGGLFGAGFGQALLHGRLGRRQDRRCCRRRRPTSSTR